MYRRQTIHAAPATAKRPFQTAGSSGFLACQFTCTLPIGERSAVCAPSYSSVCAAPPRMGEDSACLPFRPESQAAIHWHCSNFAAQTVLVTDCSTCTPIHDAWRLLMPNRTAGHIKLLLVDDNHRGGAPRGRHEIVPGGSKRFIQRQTITTV